MCVALSKLKSFDIYLYQHACKSVTLRQIIILQILLITQNAKQICKCYLSCDASLENESFLINPISLKIFQKLFLNPEVKSESREFCLVFCSFMSD